MRAGSGGSLAILLVLVVAIVMMAAPTALAAGTVTFSNESPARNAIVSTPGAQTIKVDMVGSQAISKTGYKVVVDGVTVVARQCYLTFSGAGNLNANSLAYVNIPANGLHTVAVTVTNSSGSAFTDTWTFRIGVPPTLGTPSPAAGSLVTTTSPTIAIPASSNGALASWSATVNGIATPASYSSASGSVRVAPATPLADDATATVSVSITDAAGLTVSKTWSFYVQTRPDMLSEAYLCQSCHYLYENDPDMGSGCVNCHGGPNFPHKGTPTSYHKSADVSSCTPCHVSQITAEHAGRKTKTGADIGCLTCHNSTLPEVVAAIATGNSDCLACHGPTSANPIHDLAGVHASEITSAPITISGTDFGSQDCDQCHASTSLTVLHNNTCATCHPTPRNTLTGGWNKSCVQGGCHTAGSTKPMHANIDTAHAVTLPTCGDDGCHAGGTNAAAYHKTVGCGACHGSGTPVKTCASCHNVDSPHVDLTDAHTASLGNAPISIKGTDYGTHACSECHKSALITTVHNDQCGTCHPTPRNSLTGGWDNSCAQGDCHAGASTKPMHGNIDAGHDVGIADAGCATGAGCHTGGLAAIHASAATTISGEPRTSCAVCHADGTVPASSCVTCHGDTSPIHSNYAAHTASPASETISISGVDYGKRACDSCHALEIMTAHGGECGTCHPTPKSTLTPSWDKSCAQGACHTAGSTKPMHAAIDAKHVRPSASNGCFVDGCHTDANIAALHANSPRSPSPGSRASCDICHASGVIPTSDCSTCHDLGSPHGGLTPLHAAAPASETISFGGANYGTHACDECHPSSALLTIHNNDCVTCHPSPKDSLGGAWDKSCAQGACHTAGTSKPMHKDIAVVHVVARNSCSAVGCHFDTGTSVAALHSNATTTVAGETLTSCQICHAPGRTASTDCAACHDVGDPHGDTTAIHTTTTPISCTGSNCHGTTCVLSTLHAKEGCGTCHAPDKTLTADCSVCHVNSAYSHGYTAPNHTPSAVTANITILGTTFTDVVCADCHNPTTGTLDLKPVHVTVGRGSCTQCHPTIVPTKVPTWDRTCAQANCHSVTDTNPQHKNIDTAHAMVPVAKDCLAGGKCHSGTSLPQIHSNATTTVAGETFTGCQVCHRKSMTPPVVPDFTDPNGSVWSNECLGCHPDRWEQHGYNATWHQSSITTADVTVDTWTTKDVACAECHKTELAPEHLKSGLGCDNCHPSPRDVFTTWNKSCQQGNCHTATSTSPMHDKITARHMPGPNSQSCVIDGCHLGDTIAPGWGTNLPQIHKDATTTVNGEVVSSCMVCHFNNEYRPGGTTTETPTFSTDALGIPNTRECGDCHPQGNNVMHAYSFVNHTSAPASQTITIGATTWPQMPCTRCHYTELSSEHARNISGFKSKGCANCHPAPYDSLEPVGQAIGGWNKGCVQAGCHTVGGANEMHKSVTASHTPDPANASCFTGTACHTNDGVTTADIHSRATTTTAQGVVRTSCDVCHGDYAKQSQPPSKDCTYCHPKMFANGAVVSHVDTDTLHPSPSTGCSSDTNSCHFNTLMKEHARYTPTGGGTFTCQTCHSSSDSTVRAAISSHNMACDACHTTHHGSQNPADNTSCQDCHGPSSAEMSAVSTSGAYDNTAGDHQTGFSASAHSSIQTTPTLGSQATTIQCTVCHNHSRAIAKKVDYRYTGFPDPAQNHEDLCFQCHTSQATVVNEPNKPNTWNGRSVQADFQKASKHTISTGAGSYVDQEVYTTLNDTTYAQLFAETRSNLQVTAAPAVILAQDSSGGTNPAAQTGLIFANVGGSTGMNQYKQADGAWNGSNSALFTPAAAPGSPATGASMFRLPNDPKIYLPTASTCYVYTPPADPTTDSWTTNTNFAAGAAVAAGGDTAVDATGTATTGQVVYYTRGGSTNYIYWKPLGGSATATYGRIQYPSGTTLNQGAGSAIAFAPMSNRVFVINKNGTTGDGRLYYYTGFNRPANTSLVFTQGPLVSRAAGTTAYNRMVNATIGGTDYLFTFGTSNANSITLQVVTNVASTPAILGTGIKAPAGWTTLGDGMDLEYNANDGYLYATRGGGVAGFARIQVPANPGVASSWTGVAWEVLNGTQTWPAGSAIAIANADPLTQVPFKYFGAGTMTSPDISPIAGSSRWGKLAFTANTPASAILSMKVEGYSGSAWSTLVPAALTSPVDLTGYTTAAYTKMRVTATFSTSAPSDPAATPQLTAWSLSNIKQTYVAPSGSMIQCENCHNTHLAQKGSGPWNMSRVSDPTNTKVVWSGTPTAFCLKCHTGATAQPAGLTPFLSATSMIPYQVAFRSVTTSFFPGFSKAVTGFEFVTSGHWTTSSANKAGCQNCHDPHGSDNPEMVAYTPPTGATVANSRVNTGTASREENLCYKCHNSTSGTASGRYMDVQSPNAAANYGHPITNYSGRHSDEETVGAFAKAATRHVECADCHDPHASQVGTHTAGTSAGGAAIRGAYGIVPPTASNWATPVVGSYVTTRMASGVNEAYLCFKCHAGPGALLGSVTTTSGTGIRTDLGQEFNPNNFSVHNVTGQATGMKTSFNPSGTTYTWTVPTATNVFKTGWNANSKVTCTDCHTGGSATQAKGPHGSTARWLIDPSYPTAYDDATNAKMGTTINAGLICMKCHSSTLRSANTGHNGSSSHNIACVRCHIGIPHGWKRPRMLVYASDPAPYKSPSYTTGLSGVTAKNHTAGSWSENGDCATSCGHHSSTVSPLFP